MLSGDPGKLIQPCDQNQYTVTKNLQGESRIFGRNDFGGNQIGNCGVVHACQDMI